MHKINLKASEKEGKDTRLMEICDKEGDILRDLNTYIPNLMNRLWEQPKIVVSVIEHAKKEELKKHLAPLFANNFYENILSSYYIEDNLMYVLTLLIQNEINKLNTINKKNTFLENTNCGIFLEELRRKSDIQAYFYNIIANAIENLEANKSTFKINFGPDEIAKFQTKKHSNKDDAYLKYPTNEQVSESESLEGQTRDKKKDQNEQENFNKNYIPNLDKVALKKLIEENKNDKNMYDYLYSKLTECEKDEKIFANERLLTHFSKFKKPEGLIIIYQKYFMVVINFIDQIIEKILNSFHLVPYSIKCLCRIISEAITKKFPTINIPEKNAFIAKFFFGKLLLPILKNPGVEAFVNNFISENSLYNLKIISNILERYVSGTFYKANEEEFNYTPYNWYFINNTKNIFKIFEELIKVRFPLFIENLVNNKLPPDYEYDYFKENPDEVVNYRSIFFNIEQVKILAETMDANEKEIFKDKKSIKIKKAVEKLMQTNNQQLFQGIINSEREIKSEVKKDKNKKKEKEKEKDKDKDKKKPEDSDEKENGPKVHYFLLASLDANDKYKKLFSIQQRSIYTIKELKDEQSEEAITKNNIIKVKNFFFSLLYNYHKLIKTDFDEGTTESTEKILNELNIFMKSSNFVMDGSIPSEWYVKSLLEYLQKLPSDLTKNDCEELYNQMENELNNSIKQYDFESLSFIMGKLKFADRSESYYQRSLELLEDIESNEEVRKIISNLFIPVEIKFEYESESNETDNLDNSKFKIEESKFKEKDKSNEEKKLKYEKSNKIRLSTSIENFPKKFPNLVKFQEMQDADIFEIQEKLHFPDEISKYFDLIRDNLKKLNYKNLEVLMDKIYDYLMGKLYDKIYPVEPLDEDTKIFQKSVLLSWTKPKHFLKTKKEFVFGSFENDVLEYFKLLDNDKSPRKKLIDMDGVFNSIGFLLRFNGKGPDTGVDDQIPILNYAFIKAQALRMNSNVRFMELYIGDKKSKKEGSQLTQFKGICEMIPNIKYDALNDVTKEEFVKRCKEATLEVKNK